MVNHAYRRGPAAWAARGTGGGPRGGAATHLRRTCGRAGAGDRPGADDVRYLVVRVEGGHLLHASRAGGGVFSSFSRQGVIISENQLYVCETPRAMWLVSGPSFPLMLMGTPHVTGRNRAFYIEHNVLSSLSFPHDIGEKSCLSYNIV